MRKLLVFAIVLAVCASPAFGNAIIGPKLMKALESSERGEMLPVMISLKKEVDAKQMMRAHGVRSKAQIFDILKDRCGVEQNFVKVLCNRLESNGQVKDVVAFWLANAIALHATADAVRELATQPDIHSLILDEEQVMIHPIESAPVRSLWGLSHIKSQDVNNQGFKGQGVTVAVVDTGIDTDHSAFSSGQVLVSDSKSFVSGEPTVEDGHGHGTHCAGTVLSHQYGVAPEAKLIGVKVLSSSGSGSWNSVMQGVQYAATKADILSMSLGGTASSSGNVVETAVKNAINGGTTIVIAAGNSGPWPRTIGTPGVVKEAITVGAIQQGGGIASFSSRGPTVYGDSKPDITAPGVGVLSAWKNGGTNTISGTSMATPHVAGLVALMLSKVKGKSPESVKSTIMGNTQGQTGENTHGNGCVDAPKAVSKTTLDTMDTNRWEITFEVESKADGSLSQSGEKWVPFALNVNSFKASAGFGHVNFKFNGKDMWDGAVEAGKVYKKNVKVEAGTVTYSVNAHNGPKSTTVKLTIYF